MRLIATFALFAVAAAAIAQEPTPAEPETIPAIEQEPAAPAVEHEPAAVVAEAPVYAAAEVCCPIEVARHRVTRSAKELYACQDVVPVTLCVENPADCCHYNVTLCVPCCCLDEARLCGADCGFLGRGLVTYQWSCGLCAEIVFRARGDAVVVYSM